MAVFLTHCGWNSIIEGLIVGVTMLAWAMGADQFVNANLLVDEFKVVIRANCEGAKTIPNSRSWQVYWLIRLWKYKEKE